MRISGLLPSLSPEAGTNSTHSNVAMQPEIIDIGGYETDHPGKREDDGSGLQAAS